MKLLSLCLFLTASLLLLDHNSALAEPYNPLKTIENSSSKPIDITMRDKNRDRDIPLRIYLPAQKQAAPVVLFSHGLGGSRTGCQYLGEHWSARGYVVVYMQHAGSDEAVWKQAPLLERLKAMNAATTVQNTVDRYQDVSA
ncbi:MAG TPA: dienelactone hydrolase, partial [Gimesia maris]|nr:dienelactone hydrolase [Gimesia maris]